MGTIFLIVKNGDNPKKILAIRMNTEVSDEKWKYWYKILIYLYLYISI